VDQVDGDGGEEEGEDLPHRGRERLAQDPGDPVGEKKDGEEKDHVHPQGQEGPREGDGFREDEGGGEGRRPRDDRDPEGNRPDGARHEGGASRLLRVLVPEEVRDRQHQEKETPGQGEVPEGETQEVEERGSEDVEKEDGQEGGQDRRPGRPSFLGPLHALC